MGTLIVFNFMIFLKLIEQIPYKITVFRTMKVDFVIWGLFATNGKNRID